MKYRRALLVAELHADPRPVVCTLGRVAPGLEQLVILAKTRALASWWPGTAADEPDAGELVSLERWRAEAAALPASVEAQLAPGLSAEALVELGLAREIDLLVGAARTLDGATLLQEAAPRLGVAVLWPTGVAPTRPFRHLFCPAITRRSRASLAAHLHERLDPSLELTIVGPPMAESDLAGALHVLGIHAQVRVLSRAPSIRSALEVARSGPVDLVVVASVPLPLVVADVWPAPLLVVPQASGSSRPPAIDVADVVELGSALRVRVDQAGPLGALEPAAHRALAFVSDGRVIATATTAPTGEVELPANLAAQWIGVVEGAAPDAFAAVERRFAVIRPTDQSLVLYDAELPDDRLSRLAELARGSTIETLAVRLRPTRPVAEVRKRLQGASLPTLVVDARAVLDEGDAFDVAEANDPVRLRRVAAHVQAAGHRVVSVYDRDHEQPEPVS